MSLPPGWAEFNEASAVFRGRMVGASGTFSGSFSSDSVDIVESLNIRDGAVSGYYGFDFPAGSMDATFTIPGQPYAQVIEIIAPISVTAWGSNNTDSRGGKLLLYKNGTLIRRELVTMIVGRTAYNKSGSYFAEEYMYMLQSARFLDFNVSSNQNSTYRIVCQNGVRSGSDPDGNVTLNLLGSIVVGVRKR